MSWQKPPATSYSDLNPKTSGSLCIRGNSMPLAEVPACKIKMDCRTMKRILLIFIPVLVLLHACELPVKRAEHKAISNEINTLMSAVLHDAEKLETGTLETYLDEEPLAHFYMNAKVYRKKNLLDDLRRSYSRLSSQKLVVIEPRTIVVSRRGVLWTAQISTLAIDKDGKEHSNSKSVSWLWQKKNRNWSITHLNEAWAVK